MMLAPVETVATEAPPEIPAITKRFANLGWVMVLRRDETGQIVTGLTAQGLAVLRVLEDQRTFEAIRKRLWELA